MNLLLERPHKREISPGAFVELNRGWIGAEPASRLLEHCLGLDWEHREFREGTMMPRLEAIYGEPGSKYTYSGLTYHTKPWTPALSSVAGHIRSQAGHVFTAVFCNLYRNERDYIGWHSDFERNLGPSWPDDVVVASLSLGASRRFRLKRNDDPEALESWQWNLDHGDLVIMSGATMRDWVHCVPKESEARGPRVNLTFRMLT